MGAEPDLLGALPARHLSARWDDYARRGARGRHVAGQEQFWLVKLNRTGNIDFPYRTGLAGSSYTNEHAVSFSISTDAIDVSVIVRNFASELKTEITPMVALQQAP